MSSKAVAGAFSALALVAGPACAADYFPEFPEEIRGGYNADWDMTDYGDPLDFEFGVRYFYSIGARDMTSGGNSYEIEDTSHTLELHGRIDDNSTGTYLKGYLGFAGMMDGTTESPLTGGAVTTDSSRLLYVLGDFGYLGFGADSFGFGPFAGYQFVQENAEVQGVGEAVNTDIHMLRLGLAARTEISDVIDLQAEVALVPYAYQSGSAAGGVNLDSQLFGITGEAMAGFHVTDNLTIRGGGRVWYLTDSLDASARDYSNLRYGALLEATYAF